MRLLFFFVLLLTVYCPVQGQGFYNHHSPFIDRKKIVAMGITSVTATDHYADSSFHPLSNFVSTYTFDNTGTIVYRKHWLNPEAKKKELRKFVYLALVVDSLISHSAIDYGYKIITSSRTVKFNQYRHRTKKYITYTFNQFIFSPKADKNILSTEQYSGGPYIRDTILLGKRMSIGEWDFRSSDSVEVRGDIMLIFPSIYYHGLLYITIEGNLCIEYYNQGENKPWRSSFYNQLGWLDYETQNKYTTRYYYTDEGLHIKTEDYEDGELRGSTAFTYNYKAGK